jgi:NAD(P)-dependent dehydrogenase (short-subunit alcohol dehydrogenase family)
LFAKNGYSVALIGRGAKVASQLAETISADGGHATPFSLPSYSHEDITETWSAIHKHFPKPEYAVRAALFNVSGRVFKPFLDTTPEDVQECLQTGVAAAFSFSRGAILSFKENDNEKPSGKRGTLIFTGATAGIRGNTYTSAFASSKFGVRALSQSLAKEFGKEDIHVAHVSCYTRLILDSLSASRPLVNHRRRFVQLISAQLLL